MTRLLPLLLAALLVLLGGCFPLGTVDVHAVSPATPVVGGPLLVTGQGFGDAPGSVRIGDLALAASNVELWTPTQVRVTVPTGAPNGRVTIVAADGRSGTSAAAVTVVARLVVAPLTPIGDTEVYEVLAQASDAAGEPVPGVAVSFYADDGVIDPASTVTDAGGQAHATLDLTGTGSRPLVEVFAMSRLRSVATYAEPGTYQLGQELTLGGDGLDIPFYAEVPGDLTGLTARFGTLNRRPAGPPTPEAARAASRRPPAAAPAVPEAVDEVIVVYRHSDRAGLATRERAVDALGLRRLRRLGDVELLRVPPGMSAEQAARQLQADPSVQVAAPNHRMYLLGLPTDPDLHLQWGPFAVGAPFAWAYETGAAAEVTVAVIDSAIDLLHPDLVPSLLPGFDFCADDKPSCSAMDPDPYGATSGAQHGTHVAGTVAGAANGYGTVGVAPGVRVLPVKVFPVTGGSTSVLTVDRAIRWAAGLPVTGAPDNPYPADVINLSLGTPEGNAVLAATIAEVQSLGVVVVAATGNQGSTAVNFPAAAAGVIGVGALDPDLRVAAYSNYGVGDAGPGGVDLVAPGTAVRGPLPGGASWEMDGTSMAAPHVSAAAALLLARQPGLAPDEVESRLKATAYFDPGFMDAERYGAGLLRVDGAIGLPSPTSPATRDAVLHVTTPFGSLTTTLDLLSGDTGPVTTGALQAGDRVDLVLETGAASYSGSFEVP
ncbi:MAG TPA: S8 family serine peptidase [Trueperaceae bacterium]